MAINPESLSNLRPGNKRGPSKITKAVKEAVLGAAEAHGADGEGEGGLQGYMFKLASEEPKAFAGLLGRIIPLDVNHGGRVGISPAPISPEQWAEQHAGDE